MAICVSPCHRPSAVGEGTTNAVPVYGLFVSSAPLCCLLLRELGLICHEPTMLEVAAERAVLSQLLIPAPAAQQTGGSKSSSRSGPAVPTLAPTLSGISSVTGLPLLPNFAIACHAGFDSHEGSLRVDGLVASEDGRTLHRLQVLGGAAAPEDAEKLGKQLGQQLRAVAAQHGWLDK